MFGIIFWVAFGLAIGWTAAILRDAKGRGDVVAFLLVGGIGGTVGGFIGGVLDPATSGYRTAATDIMFAVFGATAFVLFTGLVLERRTGQS